jgi:undecaprenyl-diphosphatase
MSVVTAVPAAGAETDWKRAWPLTRPAVLRLVGGGVILLVIWTALGFVVTGPLSTSVADADRRLSRWIADRRTPTWDTWSHYGSMLSETVVKILLVAVVGGAMIRVWRRWHDGVFLAVVVIFEASVFAVSSLIVDRERPPIEQLDAIPVSGSFPSGHTAAAVAFYLGLYVVARWHTSDRAVRVVLLVVGLVVPIIVASSRVYRGMHHVSDVVAGYGLGLASLVVVNAAFVAGVAELARRSDETAPYPPQTRALTLVRGTDDPPPPWGVGGGDPRVRVEGAS